MTTKKKPTEKYSERTILTRISPALRKKVEKVAKMKSWTLSHTAAVALEQLVERIG